MRIFFGTSALGKLLVPAAGTDKMSNHFESDSAPSSVNSATGRIAVIMPPVHAWSTNGRWEVCCPRCQQRMPARPGCCSRMFPPAHPSIGFISMAPAKHRPRRFPFHSSFGAMTPAPQHPTPPNHCTAVAWERLRRARWRSVWPVAVIAAILTGCGGGSETPPNSASSDLSVIGSQQGGTPFISFVSLRGKSLARVASARFTIEPKTGSVSKPVDVVYSFEALKRRGLADVDAALLTMPVFGLYPGYANRVSIQIGFKDKSTQSFPVEITTVPYVDPTSIYDRPNILKQRAPGSNLSFDFFFIRSVLLGPIVIDTDGEIRWVASGVTDGISAVFKDNGFVVGDQSLTRFTRLELDGTRGEAFLISPTITNFHHNIDPGKQGLLGEVDSIVSGVNHIESILVEFSSGGAILREWDFTSLLGNYMQSNGDDPSAFIRPGVDWFHMNSATYDPRDDSVIVSSRENFVIKVDYRTGNIMWILGDPTKYWYSFPSLRAKALTLESGGLHPIGQHATSITADGFLMLFNDGFPSVNQPVGAPVGENRAYSAVSTYSIDPTARTAREVWRFDYGQTILSTVCSSAYEAAGGSILVNYAVANNFTKARLVGLDAQREVVFDFEYQNTARCNVAWNSTPIPFQQMTFD